jgi:hypothetical protein
MTIQHNVEWKTPELAQACYFSLDGSTLLQIYYGWMDALMNEWIGGGPGGQMDD